MHIVGAILEKLCLVAKKHCKYSWAIWICVDLVGYFIPNQSHMHKHWPVQGDAAQVQYGRGGQQDVQRGPDQAEGLAVDPVLVDQLDGTKRHHQHRHQQVGKRQGHDEVVGLDFPDGGKDVRGEFRLTSIRNYSFR